MPTYQYDCTVCGERLEVVQAFTDDPLTECPACQGRLRKVFSPVGVVFKGSGFYRTDSRAASNGSGGSKKPHEKQAGEKPPSEASSSAASSDSPSGSSSGSSGSSDSSGSSGSGSTEAA